MNRRNKIVSSAKCFMELTGIWMLILIIVIVVSTVNIISAVTGYDMTIAKEMWAISPVITGMAIISSAALVATSYITQYNLLTALPVSMETLPHQISIIMDAMFSGIMVIDFIALAAVDMKEFIFLKMALYMFLYIVSRITLYVSVRTAAKTYGKLGNVMNGILCSVGYGLSAGVNAGVCVFMGEQHELVKGKYAVLIAIAAGSIVLALISVILTHKGIKNCIRQTKKYKSVSAKKRVKVESYV